MPQIKVENPFVEAHPSAQNAIDLFGEWASKFPGGSGLRAGAAAVFEDPRIHWLDTTLREEGGSGIAGRGVLEMGPLEAGHTFMMAELGAREILAIEANALAYLKCLVVKETLGIPRASFLLGDAVEYLRRSETVFDLGVCSGFLYHLVKPVETIALLAKCCKSAYVWTVVHHPSLFEKQPEMATRFGPPQEAEWQGFRHTLHPHYYGGGIDYRKFWGGTAPSSCWMEKDDLVAALRHFGFTRVTIREEDNPFGLAISALATR